VWQAAIDEPGRCGVEADVVVADVVYAGEGTKESIKLKLAGVDDVEDKIGHAVNGDEEVRRKEGGDVVLNEVVDVFLDTR
jgi:hypothetical protein